MATAVRPVQSPSVNTSPFYSRQLRHFMAVALVTLFTSLFMIVYLMPFGNMMAVATRSEDQLSTGINDSILPMSQETFNYQGKDYPVFQTPTDSGTKPMALVKPGPTSSQFIDPSNPGAGLVTVQGKRLSITLPKVQQFNPRLQNFPDAWNLANFPLLFRNTLIIAFTGMIGALLSGICVAYAFARFPIPGKNVLFIILIATIILPSQVTLIPTYAFFASIGWTGTFLPLIVPHFFANAYNVFLLRQYFLTLPRDLDEAAMIDGAGPFQILRKVIIPQSWPAIISVAIFHFVFAWNDFFAPLIYLLGKPDLQPISVGIEIFNFQYGPKPQLVQATSLMAMILPIVIFFAAQRFFMRGVVITGVEK